MGMEVGRRVERDRCEAGFGEDDQVTGAVPDPAAERWTSSDVAAYTGVGASAESVHRSRTQATASNQTIGEATHAAVPNLAASPRGTFAQISDDLRFRIEARRITGGLPSEAELGKEFGVSRTTIRRALKVLADGGLIASVPGVGWRVSGTADLRPLAERMLAEFEGKLIGDSFPSERQLCEKYGVSRPPIRNVLAQLEGSGLLHNQPGKGRQIVALPTHNEGS